MRARVVAGILALVAVGAAGVEAMAQGGRGLQGGRDQNSQQQQQGKQPTRPPPPPPMRCADLAIGDYTIGAIAPNAQPLGADEIGVRWEVRNAGGAPYFTPDNSLQWVALEYVTPGGPQQISVNPLPETLPAVPADTGVREMMQLPPGGSWRGYLRATLPAEALRRPLRLRITYAPTRGVTQDCDMDNNTAPIRR